jgi:uncharacterized membrane protein
MQFHHSSISCVASVFASPRKTFLVLISELRVLSRVSLTDEKEVHHPRPRIEGLSDLIFGLALSLSAYSLLTRPPATLTSLASDLVAFTFSFLILISVWMRYTSIMSVLPVENRVTRMLNIAMLFSVSLVPYLFNLVTLYEHVNETVIVEYASVFFAADMAALVAILAFFIHELAMEEKQLIAQELMQPYRRVRNSKLISTLLFLFTMVPMFWDWRIIDVPLRFFCGSFQSLYSGSDGCREKQSSLNRLLIIESGS